MARPRALILDYGKVLSLPQPSGAQEQMARLCGVVTDAFEAAYWRHRRDYDLGVPAADYWRRVLADAGAVPGAALVEALIRTDVESWTHYAQEMWDLATDAHAEGIRTAILSNGVPEVMARVARERPLDTIFDAVIVSCEVGCAKPDAEIYRLTLERLGVEAAEALFVDDRSENIDAARALGLRTVLFDTRSAIASVGRQLE
jgi:putative hydrolase of the HAD superfamily